MFLVSLIGLLTVNISFPHRVRIAFVAFCCSSSDLKDKADQITPPLAVCRLPPPLSPL